MLLAKDYTQHVNSYIKVVRESIFFGKDPNLTFNFFIKGNQYGVICNHRDYFKIKDNQYYIKPLMFDRHDLGFVDGMWSWGIGANLNISSKHELQNLIAEGALREEKYELWLPTRLLRDNMVESDMLYNGKYVEIRGSVFVYREGRNFTHVLEYMAEKPKILLGDYSWITRGREKIFFNQHRKWVSFRSRFWQTTPWVEKVSYNPGSKVIVDTIVEHKHVKDYSIVNHINEDKIFLNPLNPTQSWSHHQQEVPDDFTYRKSAMTLGPQSERVESKIYKIGRTRFCSTEFATKDYLGTVIIDEKQYGGYRKARS